MSVVVDLLQCLALSNMTVIFSNLVLMKRERSGSATVTGLSPIQ